MNEPEITLPFNSDGYEEHDVPFGTLPVLGFSQAPLRQAVADWWRTHDGVLGELMRLIQTKGEARASDRPASLMSVIVQLNLNYPLQNAWSLRTEVLLSELGQVFGLAYDMYRHVYALDDKAWTNNGFDEAPRLNETMSNRAQGSFVWGHDLSDLVFEAVLFSPSQDIDPFDPDAEMPEQAPFLGRFAFNIGS